MVMISVLSPFIKYRVGKAAYYCPPNWLAAGRQKNLPAADTAAQTYWFYFLIFGFKFNFGPLTLAVDSKFFCLPTLIYGLGLSLF